MGLNTKHLLICVLFVSGCALTPEPEAPTLPQPEIIAPLSETFTAPYCPLDRVEVALLPRQELPPILPSKASRATKKGRPALTPAQLVTQAQKAARVEPSERGYYAGSGEQTYVYAPGKVYTIYLSAKQGTGIFLPPGEKLVSGLYLDPEAYEVKTKRAGTGDSAYDALMIRPMIDKGEVDTFILAESGRRYLLRLVTGNVGMLAVTFEGPSSPTQARFSVEPTPILPRPPQ
ncbi:MAG TPA: hypothetical protein VI542_16275 [Candidatus Tectomicrobia bacterium]